MSTVKMRYPFEEVRKMARDLQTLRETYGYPNYLFLKREDPRQYGTPDLHDSELHLFLQGANLQLMEVHLNLLPKRLSEFRKKYERAKRFTKTEAIKALRSVEAPAEVLDKLKQPVSVEAWVKIVSDQKKGQSSAESNVRSENSLGKFASFESSYDGTPFRISILPKCDLQWAEIMEGGGEIPAKSLRFAFSFEADYQISQEKVEKILTEEGFQVFPGEIRSWSRSSWDHPSFVVEFGHGEKDFPARIGEVLKKYPKLSHLALWTRSGTLFQVMFLNEDASGHIRFDVELFPEKLLRSPLQEQEGDRRTFFGPSSCSWSTSSAEKMRRVLSIITEEEIIPKGYDIPEVAKKWDEGIPKSRKRKGYSKTTFSGEVDGLQIEAELSADKRAPFSISIEMNYDLEPLLQRALGRLQKHFEVIQGYASR